MTDLENRIEELEKQLKQKNEYISQLEQVNEAYDRLEQLTHQELLDADQTSKAQEMISEAMRKEQLEALQTIEAHEHLAELINIEKQEDRKIMEAQAELSHLSIQELRERDITLQNILKISRDLSLILDEKKMLRRILSTLMKTLKAERGALFFLQKGKLIPKVRKKLPAKLLKTAKFQQAFSLIERSYKKKQSNLHIFQDESKKSNWSVLSVPLIYEKKCLGVIYLDLISDDRNFHNMDLEIAKIFSLHAAILLNNVSLYEKIKKQNLQLLKLLNLKNQMLEQLSEEVNTPIGKIDQRIRVLFDSLEFSEDQARNSELILSHLEKVQITLVRVINLQELEKEVDELFRDEIHFQELFQIILNSHQRVIESKNIQINLSLTPSCAHYHGNKVILRTLFDELVSNAVFYNKENGEVNIRGSKKGDHLVFEIKDTGRGMSKEELEHIFEQFYRAESSETLNERGAGLGLFMVKSFVQHYLGDIKVKSTPGKGSIFTVSLLAN